MKNNLYSRIDLSEVYNLSSDVVGKMLAGIGIVAKDPNGRHLWNLGDVTELKDTRIKSSVAKNQWGEWDSSDDGEAFETDPNKMKPTDRRLYWQSVDLEQAAMLKQRKNAIESRELIPNDEVARTLTMAFKTVALTLDTLPDVLERDGIIGSGDIQTVIGILDSAREQLGNDLQIDKVRPYTELLKIMGG